MIKELVCTDCGCEDVKLVSETVKIQARTGFSNILWLIIAVIPIAVGITALCLSFSAYWKATQGNSTLSAENTAYISKMFFIGCIACFAGIFLILITLVLYLYNTYETETRLIAVCPHCGKSWTLSMNKKGHLSYYKNSGERSHAMFTREKPDADTEQNADNQKKE